YTWAGWADPIRRVGSFRDRFRAFAGHPPQGLEQEGYDAVRTLVAGLQATHGVGGVRLTGALESLPDHTYSSFPIHFGPDDHTFLPRDELGLFAVPGRSEPLDAWMVRGADGWRALMRTFTYDGESTNVLDADR